jgi:hypothetical protein
MPRPGAPGKARPPALAGGEAADAFLGTQGDVWDTQWDMFLALLGAITAQLTQSRPHDRALDALRNRMIPDTLPGVPVPG